MPNGLCLQLRRLSNPAPLVSACFRMERAKFQDQRLRDGDESNLEEAVASQASALQESQSAAAKGGWRFGLWASGLAKRIFGSGKQSQRRRALPDRGAADTPTCADDAGDSAASARSTPFATAPLTACCGLLVHLACGPPAWGGALPRAAGGASKRPVIDRNGLLSYLAFRPSVNAVRRLWYWIDDERTRPGGVATHFADSEALPALAQPAGVHAAFCLQCMCFSLALEVVDDLELQDLEAPQPLPLRHIRRHIAFCRDVVSTALGTRPSRRNAELLAAAPSPFWGPFSHSVAAVMRALHERHTRRPLSNDESLWIIDSQAAARRLSREQLRSLQRWQLAHLPFTIPFEQRQAGLRGQIGHAFELAERAQGFRVTISRAAIFEDAFRALRRVPAGGLRGRVYVVFVDEYGEREEGIDAGGLFKELWTELAKQVFDPSYGLFRATSSNQLYPNPASAVAAGPEHLAMFEFCGRLLGKAVWDGINVQPQFAHFFLAQVLGKRPQLHHLASLDADLYKNLMFIKTYDGDVENDLCLTFTMPGDEADMGAGAAAAAAGGGAGEVELIPGGGHVPVTAANRIPYVYRVAEVRLNHSIAPQLAAFRAGFLDVVDADWLRPFSEPELQTLISGASGTIDLEDLKQHTRYMNGGLLGSRAIQHFWAVAEELDEAGRAALLMFVTACERPPSLGFKALNPPFAINLLPRSDRLPTAATCFNTLKLPAYSSRSVMREKLRTAIFSGKGFGLS